MLKSTERNTGKDGGDRMILTTENSVTLTIRKDDVRALIIELDKLLNTDDDLRLSYREKIERYFIVFDLKRKLVRAVEEI